MNKINWKIFFKIILFYFKHKLQLSKSLKMAHSCPQLCHTNAYLAKQLSQTVWKSRAYPGPFFHFSPISEARPVGKNLAWKKSPSVQNKFSLFRMDPRQSGAHIKRGRTVTDMGLILFLTQFMAGLWGNKMRTTPWAALVLVGGQGALISETPRYRRMTFIWQGLIFSWTIVK